MAAKEPPRAISPSVAERPARVNSPPTGAPRSGAKADAKLGRSKLQPSGAYGMDDIRRLARMLSRYDLSELEVEHLGQRIRLRRERLAGGALAPAAPPPPAATQMTGAAPKRGSEAKDGTALITSPFVGTFYRAATPEGTPFIEVGQTANKGQVLCIVEAMKLMNEIEADANCRILDVLVQNGDPVEFGQPLFKITPLA